MMIPQSSNVYPLDLGKDRLIVMLVILQDLVHDPAIGISDDKTKISMPIGLIRDSIDDLADLDPAIRIDGHGYVTELLFDN
jgi:hypothetical protein